MTEKSKTMEEELLEEERWIDDDYQMINAYYKAKRRYPDIPFYLQDENGETYEFNMTVIYQYIGKLNK